MVKKIIFVLFSTLLVIIILLPFFPLILYSLSNDWIFPEIFPKNINIKWWRYVFFDIKTWKALGMSFSIASIVVVINLLLCIPAANVIGRGKIRYRIIFEVILFAPLIIPSFISIMGIHLIFIKLKLTETIVGVILVHIIPTLPYMMRALILSFEMLSEDYENLSFVFGANIIQKYWYVIIPHILPAIISGSSLTLLISFSNYVLTLMIGGGEVLTMPILLFPFINGGNRAIGSVYAVIFIFINIIALLLMEKILRIIYKRPIEIIE